MLILLLAAQLSAPNPNPASWIKANDYPAQYVKAGRSFEVDIRATVRPDGSVQECSIEKSSGEKAFDKYNCALLISRTKFRPATDANGQPVLGVFRTRVAWQLEDRKPQGTAGDLELTIAKLPDGLKSPALIDVALAVDSTGQPTDCANAKQEQNAVLVKAACSQLVRSYRAFPARSATGERVPSVQTAQVTFLSP